MAQLPATASADEELFEAVRNQVSKRLSPRELRGEAVAGLLFMATALALVAWSPGESEPALALALVVAYALAAHIRFEIATGFTVPTQLALVPMLLLTEPALVPLLVVAGNMAGERRTMCAGGGTRSGH